MRPQQYSTVQVGDRDIEADAVEIAELGFHAVLVLEGLRNTFEPSNYARIEGVHYTGGCRATNGLVKYSTRMKERKKEKKKRRAHRNLIQNGVRNTPSKPSLFFT